MSRSAFDDLLDLGGTTENSNQSADPFDLLGTSQTTNQNATNSGGALLDLGFDFQVSSNNEQSGSVELNTNPLYEFTKSYNTLDIMASETENPLLDFGSEPQKEVKSDTSSTNPLYDFIESENTNGHVDDIITNGDAQTVDLLDNSGDLLGGPVTVTSDDSGVTVDINNISDVQKEEEEEEEEEATEDNIEGNVEEEIEEDQDTGNVEDIGSEQITEPEVEDQLEEQLQDEGPADVNEHKATDGSIPVSEIQDNDLGVKEVLDDRTNEKVKDDEISDVQDGRDDGGYMQEVEADKCVEEPVVPKQDEGFEIVETADVEAKEEGQISDTLDVAEEESKISNEDVEITGSALIPEKTQLAQEADPVEFDDVEEGTQSEETIKVEAIPGQEDTPEALQEAEIISENAEVVETVPESLKGPQPESVPEILVEQSDDIDAGTEDDEEKIPEQPIYPEPVLNDISGSTEAPGVNDNAEFIEEAVDDTPLEEQDFKENDAGEALGVSVTFTSTSFVVLSPTSSSQFEKFKKDAADTKVTEEVKVNPEDIKKPEPAEENAHKVNGTTEVKENGTADEEVIRDPDIYRETHEKEEVHFAEMNNYRQKFESGAVTENESTPKKVSVKEEYDEGGEFENTPTVNEDVVKETDQQKEELPEVGMAKNLLDKFKTLQEESSQTVTSQKRVSPPRNEKVEYENQPTQRNIVYENKSDEGVFESTPKEIEDVVRSADKAEDVQVEAGLTKNLLSKFKEIETESSAYKAREKRELTPDKSGKVEYVSEPRGQHITYEESKSETGVYENVPAEEEDVVRSADKAEEIMPESGMAQNLLSKFKQMESETANNPPPSPKRGTPYQPKPKEQRGYLERFSPKLEEGEFENEPHVPAEVVRSGDQQEDVKPESGAAKKTLEKFKELEQHGSPPKAPDYRKDFTPPRETSPGKTVSGVLENEPEHRPDVIRNADKAVDELPEQGTAKNILEKFKQIQSAENSPSSSPNKKYKEFTPPPEAGVYENVPKEHLVIEQRQSEVGVLESTPGKSVADIPREERETMSPEAELPEKGMARNLVSKFKQLESESAKNSKSTSPKFKEFTPPRDTRNILSPKSPAEHQNGVHPSDLPEQYQEQTSPGIFESSPEVRKDVYREADTDWEQGLPAKNTTLSMVEKFRNIQQKAKEDEDAPSPTSRKDDSPSPPDHEEKGMFRVVQSEKCPACQKTVYAMEKLEMNGTTYHRNCFKCSHCSARLTAKTFSMNEGVIYCTNHFKQLFARKGNYDEGFGRQQYKKKWQDDKPKNDDSTANA